MKGMVIKMEESYHNKGDIPLGFGMALAQDIDAMSYFTNLPVSQQRAVIDGTHNVHSKREMSEYVANLKNLRYGF